MPEQDAVLVTTAGTGNMQGVLDAVWAHLLPAFDAPGSAEADVALAERLRHLDLVTDRPDPLVEQTADQVRVTAVDETDDGWVLRLDDAGRALEVPVGRGVWTRSDLSYGDAWGVRVAARGDVAGDGLAFDLVLVESPHRLRVLTGAAGSTVTWHTVPLAGSWFPDAFMGTMGSLMRYKNGETDVLPTSVEDVLKTMAVVEAAYASSDGK